MDVNYWYSIDTKWLAFYFLDRHIFTDEKYLSFLKIYSISNERYDFILFGTSLMLVNNVYRLKEEKNTMDGLCLPEMSYIISFNRIDIDGRFCSDLSRTNDEVNVAHLISLITLCSMIIIVYIFMFLHVLSYVVVEYRFSAMIRKFRISYISTTVNTWMFIHVHILNLLRFSSRTPMLKIVLDLMLDMSFSVTSAACITAVQCTILLFHFPTRLVFPYSMKKKTYQSRSVSSINDYASSSLWLTPSPMLKYMQKRKIRTLITI